MSQPDENHPPQLGSKRRQRILIAACIPLDVIVLLGAIFVPEKRTDLLTIGGIILVYLAFIIPWAKRHGRI